MLKAGTIEETNSEDYECSDVEGIRDLDSIWKPVVVVDTIIVVAVVTTVAGYDAMT